MPLHADEQGKRRILDPLDDAIGRGSDDAQAVADLVDRLLVTRVHDDIEMPDPLGHRCTGN